MSRFTFADGRPNIAAPPRRAAVRAGPPSAFQQSRELHERHKREDADIRMALRRVRAARRPVRRPLVHDRPSSTARPREGGARMVAAAGRDGTAERDDGGGGDSGDDGGGGEPPPPRSRAPFFGGAR